MTSGSIVAEVASLLGMTKAVAAPPAPTPNPSPSIPALASLGATPPATPSVPAPPPHVANHVGGVSPGATGGHWVTINHHHVFIDDNGDFHFGGMSSPGINPSDPQFHAKVASALAGSHTTQHQTGNRHTMTSSHLSDPNGSALSADLTYQGKAWKIDVKDANGNVIHTTRFAGSSKANAVAEAQRLMAATHAAHLQAYSQHHVATIAANAAAQPVSPPVQTSGQASQLQQNILHTFNQSPSLTATPTPTLAQFHQSVTFAPYAGSGNHTIATSPSGAFVDMNYTGTGFTLRLTDANGNQVSTHRIVGRGSQYAQMAASMMLYNHEHKVGIGLPPGSGHSVPGKQQTAALAMQQATMPQQTPAATAQIRTLTTSDLQPHQGPQAWNWKQGTSGDFYGPQGYWINHQSAGAHSSMYTLVDNNKQHVARYIDHTSNQLSNSHIDALGLWAEANVIPKTATPPTTSGATPPTTSGATPPTTSGATPPTTSGATPPSASSTRQITANDLSGLPAQATGWTRGSIGGYPTWTHPSGYTVFAGVTNTGVDYSVHSPPGPNSHVVASFHDPGATMTLTPLGNRVAEWAEANITPIAVSILTTSSGPQQLTASDLSSHSPLSQPGWTASPTSSGLYLWTSTNHAYSISRTLPVSGTSHFEIHGPTGIVATFDGNPLGTGMQIAGLGTGMQIAGWVDNYATTHPAPPSSPPVTSQSLGPRQVTTADLAAHSIANTGWAVRPSTSSGQQVFEHTSGYGIRNAYNSSTQHHEYDVYDPSGVMIARYVDPNSRFTDWNAKRQLANWTEANVIPKATSMAVSTIGGIPHFDETSINALKLPQRSNAWTMTNAAPNYLWTNPQTRYTATGTTNSQGEYAGTIHDASGTQVASYSGIRSSSALRATHAWADQHAQQNVPAGPQQLPATPTGPLHITSTQAATLNVKNQPKGWSHTYQQSPFGFSHVYENSGTHGYTVHEDDRPARGYEYHIVDAQGNHIATITHDYTAFRSTTDALKHAQRWADLHASGKLPVAAGGTAPAPKTRTSTHVTLTDADLLAVPNVGGIAGFGNVWQHSYGRRGIQTWNQSVTGYKLTEDSKPAFGYSYTVHDAQGKKVGTYDWKYTGLQNNNDVQNRLADWADQHAATKDTTCDVTCSCTNGRWRDVRTATTEIDNLNALWRYINSNNVTYDD
jgi:hypothetical protein